MRIPHGMNEGPDMSEGYYQEQMGMIDALHEEQAAYLRRKQAQRPDELTWVTKQGDRIRVVDMSDSHLFNTIMMLRRKVEMFRLGMLSDLWNYMGNAPDGAYDCAQSEVMTIERMTPEEFLISFKHPYKRMLQEAKERHIELPPLPVESVENINATLAMRYLCANRDFLEQPNPVDVHLTRNTSRNAQSSRGQTLKSKIFQSWNSFMRYLMLGQERKAAKPEK